MGIICRCLFRSSINYNRLGEAIIMGAHNMHFRDKIRTFLLVIHIFLVFLSFRKIFLLTQKRVRTSHCKRAIGVRVNDGSLVT